MPMEEKKEFDIGLPELTPSLVRKKSLAEEIASLDVMKMKCNPLPMDESNPDEVGTKKFIYEGRDILTDEKLFERRYKMPEVQTAQEVIGYYANKIASDVKLPSQFSALVPKIREFFERKAFGKEVNLDEPRVVKAMSSNVANFVVSKEFEKALREIVVEVKKPELLTPSRYLSTTPPFPYSKQFHKAKHTVFNLVTCDNDLEMKFAKFLDGAEDVTAFAKLPEQFGFCIEYPDTLSNIRNYYPDFVARTKKRAHWIIETKGREDIEVERKDAAALRWCENATKLTGTEWRYAKVKEKEFEKLRPATFGELSEGMVTLYRKYF